MSNDEQPDQECGRDERLGDALSRLPVLEDGPRFWTELSARLAIFDKPRSSMPLPQGDPPVSFRSASPHTAELAEPRLAEGRAPRPWRKPGMLGVAAVLVAVVAVGGTLWARGADTTRGPNLQVATQPTGTSDLGTSATTPISTSTTTLSTSTTMSTRSAAVPHQPPASTPTTSWVTTTTTEAPAVTPASSTTSTALNCYESYDPRCGTFQWSPAPQVGKMAATITLLTSSPKVGQPVDFKVVIDEPDTTIGCQSADYGDNNGMPCHGPNMTPCDSSPQATGTWPPPPKRPDHKEETLTNTYQQPGTYTVTFWAGTVVPPCHSPEDKDPYKNQATATVTVTVRP